MSLSYKIWAHFNERMLQIAKGAKIGKPDVIRYKIWKRLGKKLAKQKTIEFPEALQHQVRDIMSARTAGSVQSLRRTQINTPPVVNMSLSSAENSPDPAPATNDIFIHEASRGKVSLNIQGGNNKIRIGEITGNGTINLSMFADDCEIVIGSVTLSGILTILYGQDHFNFGKIHNAVLKIGEGCHIASASIFTLNSNSSIVVGERCYLSANTVLYNSDGHPVYKKGTRSFAERVGSMTIGNHVWLRNNVTMLINSSIADDSIVGWGSVVYGKFKKNNSYIAGNPARRIGKNIDWDFDGSKGYIQNEFD